MIDEIDVRTMTKQLFLGYFTIIIIISCIFLIFWIH